jgi:hypothetical protein
VLIDEEGKIVGRYSGAAFLAFQEALTQLVESGRKESAGDSEE